MKALVSVSLVLASWPAPRAPAGAPFVRGGYDDQKPLKITGTLTKVEWMNPHIWYYVDVKNPDGSVTTWAISGGAPGQLMRRGITKDLLVLGASVNVEGFRAKDGTNNGFGQRVTYPDGRNVFTATDPAGRAPQQ